jgi:5-methylcytosine-specific restriction enzyme subunit McrC
MFSERATYVTFSEDTRCLRGKICFSPTIKQNLFVQAKVYCDYDELSYNVIHNQILKATIRLLITEESMDKDFKDQLTGFYRRLQKIADIQLSHKIFSMVQFHRNNSFYDFLLKICELVYDNLLVTEDPGKSKFQDFFQDEKQMAYLFEEFVRNFYKIEAQSYKVSREDIHWVIKSTDEDLLSYLPVIYTCRIDWCDEDQLIDDAGNIVESLKDSNGRPIQVKKEGVHFDLAHRNRIEWEIDKLGEFKMKLENRIKAVIV